MQASAVHTKLTMQICILPAKEGSLFMLLCALSTNISSHAYSHQDVFLHGLAERDLDSVVPLPPVAFWCS